MKEVITEFNNKINNVKNRLIDELAKIRTARATPAILDSVTVSAYGAVTPINQCASIVTEGPKSLRVNPWDQSLIAGIENAITKADLGVSTTTDEKGVRITFPELTEETRTKIAKGAKQKHEEARIALRHERDSARSIVQEAQKNGEYGEDQARELLDEIDKITSITNKEFDELYDKKYTELTTL